MDGRIRRLNMIVELVHFFNPAPASVPDPAPAPSSTNCSGNEELKQFLKCLLSSIFTIQ